MPSIQRSDRADPQSFGYCDDGSVHRAEGEVAITRGQLRDAQPVTREDRLWSQRASSKITQKADLRLDTESRRDQIGNFGDHEDRDEQRPGMLLEKLEARCVVAVVRVDVRVQWAGIDQECDAPSSSDRISSTRSETSWWPLRPVPAASRCRLPRGPSDPPR